MTSRKVTNVDPKRGKKKAIWFEDTASEAEGVMRIYGPHREYVANATSVEHADQLVAGWNLLAQGGDQPIPGRCEYWPRCPLGCGCSL